MHAGLWRMLSYSLEILPSLSSNKVRYQKRCHKRRNDERRFREGMHLMSKPRQRSSHLTSPSEKNNGDATSSPATATQIPGPRPALDDQDGWKAYWAARGQPWRTEPEIDAKRQAELDQHRAIVP